MGESHHQEAQREAERVLGTPEGEKYHIQAMYIKAESLFLQSKVKSIKLITQEIILLKTQIFSSTRLW